MLQRLSIRIGRQKLGRSVPRTPFVAFRHPKYSISMMAAPKRKRSAVDAVQAVPSVEPPLKRRSSTRTAANAAVVNPNINGDIIDAPNATRASPDSDVNEDIVPGPIKSENGTKSESPLSDAPAVVEPPKKKKGRSTKAAGNSTTEGDASATNGVKKGNAKAAKIADEDSAPAPKSAKKAAKKDDGAFDPEADGDEEADEEEVKDALSRPPPVHSDYLPLPWKGRLGYACLNTYLRQSNPPVFSSRTCRIQSILEHRHPLQDPSQPEHATKNRPDTSKPADIALGQRYLESVCLANVRDIAKMLRWNDRYGIRFMRLSSEMFPFASHAEYGYKLDPFASEALAEAGRVVAELGHRVTTHPGQFTQLGSPRNPVLENAIRDLEYHDEMLTLLKLPEQQDRDAVMIMHMGGLFEGKQETLQRFRENYVKLPQSIKNRLVLENDDMGWNVHDLLPVCEELNIPLVLDYHHHNICFDATQLREGTRDIMDLYPRIKATWDRKRITQKMHYSEPTAPAITPRQRRKHSARVATLPPCADTMDLMIEAKDKEQAVFELMRTFKLPGYDTFNDILPYVRNDDNKVALAAINRKKTKKHANSDEPDPELIPEDQVGMGGPEGRVYWPPGMEEWLRPKKREVAPRKPASEKAKSKAQLEAEAIYAANEAAKKNGGVPVKVEPPAEEAEDSDPNATPATKKAKAAMKKKEAQKAAQKVAKEEAKRLVEANKAQQPRKSRKKAVKKEEPEEEEAALTPAASEDGEDGMLLPDDEDDEPVTPSMKRAGSRKTSSRKVKSKAVSYADEEEDED